MSAPAPTRSDRPVVRTMPAIGTTASVVVGDAAVADRALDLLGADLAALDAACSRFRPDSELRRLEERGGRSTRVSPLLFDALSTACEVAARTAGIVDPTIGSAVVAHGYDRDLSELDGSTPTTTADPGPAAGWWRLGLDPTERTVSVPEGVHVDLGSTGKAFGADRSARRIAAALGCGVVVNLGGDVAVAGPAPEEGWGIGIASHCTTAPERADEVVALWGGGLATSGTTSRTWYRNGKRMHHIVDPWTGDVAPTTWSLVTAFGASCVEANGWTTAAVVWGEDAPGNLAAHGVTARLVRPDGRVVRVGPWPDPRTGSEAA